MTEISDLDRVFDMLDFSEPDDKYPCKIHFNIINGFSDPRIEKDVKAFSLNNLKVLSLAARYLGKPCVLVSVGELGDEDFFRFCDVFERRLDQLFDWTDVDFGELVDKFTHHMMTDGILFFEDFDTADRFFQIFNDEFMERTTFACLYDANGVCVDENT